MNDIEADYREKDCGFERFYYRTKHIKKMVDQIVKDKESKLSRYGLKNYLKYMELEKKEKVNQRFKEEKRMRNTSTSVWKKWKW